MNVSDLIGTIDVNNLLNETQSDRLRLTISGNPIGSKKAKKAEKDLHIARHNAFLSIKTKYPDLLFKYDSKLSKQEINTVLKNNCPDIEIDVNMYAGINRNIRPDGGLTYLLSKNNNKYLIGVFEEKVQGTNDKREQEGKKKQAQGNAIERAYKNIREIENFQINEDIMPYVIFASGCDLEDEDSSIRDRITAMTNHSAFNKLYIQNEKNINGFPIKRTSVFIGIQDIEEKSKIILDVYECAIKYYLDKYSKDFI